jgi:flavin reductase (DIM6/NTAB) family NADH-FMN oxidoreductase RutF
VRVFRGHQSHFTRGKESTINLATHASAAIVHAEPDISDGPWRPAPARPPEPHAAAAMLHLLDGCSRGHFLLTAAHEGTRSGTLVRWVQPCATDPPMVAVAFRRDGIVQPLVHGSHRFALARVPDTDRLLQAVFATSHGPGEDPFLGIRTFLTPGGCPVPAATRGWLECEMAFNIDLEADCGLYVGLVSAAGRAPGDA